MSAEYPGELWRRLADALGAGDLVAMGALLTDDVVADWSRSRGPYKGVYEGREAVIGFIEDLLSTLELVSWTQEEHTEISPERMLITNRTIGRGRDSGVEVRATGASVYTVRNGKISRIEMFQSRAEALGELR